MSLVVFPFKEEKVEVVAANLATAAGHDRVHEVWAVAAAESASMTEVTRAASDVAITTGKKVDVFAQERIGSFRSGKGDGMNTAIARAAERGFDRTHFYDADITNFDESWIDGAEAAADRGYGVVRHRFPRAATDAMITWMVTRPALAKLFPGTFLPRLGQPLGGELLLGADVLARLAGNELTRARSDWGIDTIITYVTATMGEGIYEHNIPDGKRHALYGSLMDIRVMMLECLDAAASLRGRPRPPSASEFVADPPADVPDDLKATVGYDLAATRASIADDPSPAELEILASLDVDPREEGIDARRWGKILDGLLTRFQLTDPVWESAAFRMWVLRVLGYTTTEVPHGYDHAMAYLEATISGYERRAGG